MGLLDNITNAASSALGIGDSAKSKVGTTGTSTDPNLKNRNYAVIIRQAAPANRLVVGSVPDQIQVNQSAGWKTPWGAGLAGDGQIADLLAVTGNRLVAQVMTMQVWQGAGEGFNFNLIFELRTYSDPSKDVVQPVKDLIKMTVPVLDPSGFLKSPGPYLSPKGAEELGSKLGSTVTSAIQSGVSAAKSTTTTGGTTTDSNSMWAAAQNGVKAAGNSLKASGLAKKKTVQDYLSNIISIQIGQWFYMDNVVITDVQHTFHSARPDGQTGAISSATVTISFSPMFAVTDADIDNIILGGISASPVAGSSSFGSMNTSANGIGLNATKSGSTFGALS